MMTLFFWFALVDVVLALSSKISTSRHSSASIPGHGKLQRCAFPVISRMAVAQSSTCSPYACLRHSVPRRA